MLIQGVQKGKRRLRALYYLNYIISFSGTQYLFIATDTGKTISGKRLLFTGIFEIINKRDIR